jgi:hypothetical protein
MSATGRTSDLVRYMRYGSDKCFNCRGIYNQGALSWSTEHDGVFFVSDVYCNESSFSSSTRNGLRVADIVYIKLGSKTFVQPTGPIHGRECVLRTRLLLEFSDREFHFLELDPDQGNNEGHKYKTRWEMCSLLICWRGECELPTVGRINLRRF